MNLCILQIVLEEIVHEEEFSMFFSVKLPFEKSQLERFIDNHDGNYQKMCSVRDYTGYGKKII